MELNVETVKELIATIGKSGVDRLNLETKEFKLSIEKNSAVITPVAVPAAPPAKAAPALKENPCAQNQPQDAEAGNVVCSPIVGTFFESSAPDKPPFVKVGDRVKKGDTLFIVESMKLMNEIASEFDGTVAEIYAKNGSAVEYGQKIMRIE